jgi:hypothetical protein
MFRLDLCDKAHLNKKMRPANASAINARKPTCRRNSHGASGAFVRHYRVAIRGSHCNNPGVGWIGILAAGCVSKIWREIAQNLYISLNFSTKLVFRSDLERSAFHALSSHSGSDIKKTLVRGGRATP